MKNTEQKMGFWGITPLLVFLMIYLVLSIILNDFYKVPLIFAFLVSSIFSICLLRGKSISERIRIFSKGAANETLMLMVWIFILAGAFAQSAKSMGSIDATVNLALQVLPSGMILPGLFLASCFISLSIGTSVGTTVALTPIAVGISHEAGCDLPMVVACVVGGAFFGDNLSFISDTTIIATQTQGCRMRDKFLANIGLVLPAAITVLIIYIVLGSSINASSSVHEADFLKIIPYLSVLVLAIVGVNVILVLLAGIVLCCVIGLLSSSFDLWQWMAAVNEGVMGMSELIIVTLLAGSMLEVIRYLGGIEYLTSLVTKGVKGRRGAEFGIALLVVVADICTANNTIAIITTGPIAKDVAEKYGVDPRRSASILDTFSCFAQGLIPYGAQLLMASGLATTLLAEYGGGNLLPTELIPYLYYPYAIGIVSLASIAFRFPILKTGAQHN